MAKKQIVDATQAAIIQLVDIKQIKPNPENPRTISKSKFEKLVNSIKAFPEMLKIRPIVVNKDFVTLGGNMRLQACGEAGLKQVWIIQVENLTPEQEQEFIIKDNVGFGEWDFDNLANNFDQAELIEWGLDIPKMDLGGGGDGIGDEPEPKNLWFLNISLDSEAQTQHLYDELIDRGFICKIVQ